MGVSKFGNYPISLVFALFLGVGVVGHESSRRDEGTIILKPVFWG